MIIEAHLHDKEYFHQDISKLLSWNYYHDVLSLFSLLHWKRRSVEVDHLQKYRHVVLRQLIHRPSMEVRFLPLPKQIQLKQARSISYLDVL